MGPGCKLVLPLLALTLLAGCDRSEPAHDRGTGPKPARTTLTAIIVPQPRSLLPHEGFYYVDGQLSDAVFSNLVYADHRGSLSPELAERWDVSPDHRAYTFHLRRGVRFHDGRPFTADDVRFTLENLIAKTQGQFAEIRYIEGWRDFLAGRAPHVRGLRALNEHTLEVRLNSEFKFFLPFLAAEYTAILPAGFAGAGEEAFRARPLGTGPFRFAGSGRRSLGGRSYHVIRLERNREYFAAAGNVSAIEFFASNISISEDEAGTFDLVFISDSEMLRLPESSGLTLSNSSPSILNFLVLNPEENEWLRQRRVRQLISAAIDREELVRVVFQNRALPAHSMMPFGLLGHNPYYRLDTSRAAALRAELPPGPIPFSLLTVAKDSRGQVGEFIRRRLARFGFDVRVTVMDDQYQYFTRGIYETGGAVIMGGIPDYPAAFHFLSHLVEPNGYYNCRRFVLPGLQSRIESLPSLGTLAETRLLAEIGEELEREALYVPLYYYSNFIARRRNVSPITFKYGEVADLARLEVTE